MLWGYGGVLSLGQGVFFGLGGYGMAMFLKLEASDPEHHQDPVDPRHSGLHGLEPDHRTAVVLGAVQELPVHAAAVIVVPTLLACIISFAMFKRRVGGVYFAIITQAVALILTVLIIGQQGYTGGVNGMTDLKTLLGWDTRTDSAKYILYYVCVALLVLSIVLCRWIQTSKLGTLLLAMRDKEDRVRFSGYDVANFKHLRLLPGGRAVGHWRRHVHAAGGLHVAELRGHRAVDRNGDLRRGGRAHEPGGRGVRHAAGQRWARPTSPKASRICGCS